jgi:hypothetical protein
MCSTYKHGLANWKNILIANNKDFINFEILLADYLTKKFNLISLEGNRAVSTINIWNI